MNDPRVEELKTLLPRCLLHDWVRLGARLVRVLRDHHHASRHDALIDRLLERARKSAALREWRGGNVPRVSYPPELPISQRKDEIVAAIREHQVVVIAGETGSGKTTQIPKMCLEAGLGVEAMVGCTQPRRVAALSIARRIAEELGVNWGREVGSKVRFDDRTGPETFVKLVTDGMLLAEMQGDPDLSEYNALIVDEAHERSLNIDFLLGHLKGLLARRKDLKLLITSATIDTAEFSRAFGGAPVIEVSGRMYPVEVVYQPLDSESEERGDLTYIDAAVRATEQALTTPGAGDVLIFMPGERDIRETTDQIEGRFGREVEVVPLFGRLSAADQQRVFAPSQRTKVVVATNIAETSLTIPGIRYVIDTGLARVSRYNPRTRTRRLPVEPISQSSARQRQGRAGRVRDGVCIRLYSEADFGERPVQTQPEIQRANLAEVILRMKAFQLGDIETFPFLNPPTPAAIRAGYALLHELGALDEKRELTPLGRDLARLPIDPTLGRMLLHAQEEHATHELLIIAAGLSIQDPRERPLDQREAAATAHRQFVDARSDFLTLLKLWNAVHDEWEKLRTQNQRRKYCRAHFLSYTRMREWQDLYTQLHEALEELGTVRLSESSAEYGPIHRSILAGLLGHVGLRQERNVYRGAGNRDVAVFPGSALHERAPAQPKRLPGGGKGPASAPVPKTRQPAWVVAGEIVETSQLFARTLAGIEPEWIAKLGAHLCKVTHRGPHWSRSAGRVMVEEVVTLYGLEVLRRKVAYGNLEPVDATAIFLRSALVEEDLLPGEGRVAVGDAGDDGEVEDRRAGVRKVPLVGGRGPARAAVPPQYRFLEHNRRVRQKIESWRTRMRRSGGGDVDEALFQFYGERIRNVSSLDELNVLIGEKGGPEFLCAKEDDLAGNHVDEVDPVAFPDAVALGGQAVKLSYAYAPGEAWDGVTIRLPAELVNGVTEASVAWAVPSLRGEQVAELLGTLAKTHRRVLQPMAPKVEEIVRDLEPKGPTLLHDLSRFLKERYGITVPVSDWRPDAVPAHLRPRIEVMGGDAKPVAAGRDLRQVQDVVKQVKVKPTEESVDWKRVAQQWEKPAVTGWTFGDLPGKVVVGTVQGVEVYGFPAPVLEEGVVSVRLLRSEMAARSSGWAGYRRLVELGLGRDLGWLQRDLKGLAKLDALYAPLGTGAELQETAFENLKRHILPAVVPDAFTEAAFRKDLEAARGRIPGLAQAMVDRVAAVLQARQQVQQKVGAAPGSGAGTPAAAGAGRAALKDFSQLIFAAAAKPAVPAAAPVNPMAAELARLVPARFLERLPYERLSHLPRYLKALLLRAERATANPLKDRERAALIAPFAQALERIRAAQQITEEGRRAAEEFRWLVEEYKVSVFAQELGTSLPVSPKRLNEFLEGMRMEFGL